MSDSTNNPYAPPEAMGFTSSAEKTALRWIVARFRAECRALAGAALFFALLAGWISYMLRNAPRVLTNEFLCALFACLSATLVIVGLGILLKKVWAVRAFLLFNWSMALLMIPQVFYSGRFIVGEILLVAFFALAFTFASAQCHRVLGWSRKIRAAGYPLTARSEDVTGNAY